MTKEELKKRTKRFALMIIILIEELPDKKPDEQSVTR
jgi:hypothetical protein